MFENQPHEDQYATKVAHPKCRLWHRSTGCAGEQAPPNFHVTLGPITPRRSKDQLRMKHTSTGTPCQ